MAASSPGGMDGMMERGEARGDTSAEPDSSRVPRSSRQFSALSGAPVDPGVVVLLVEAAVCSR